METPRRTYDLVVTSSAGVGGQNLRRLLPLLVAASVATACTTTEPPIAHDDPQSARTSSPPAQGSTAGVPGTQVRAESATLEVWALLYEPSPWKAGQEVKVVWRATGAGSFAVTAVGPESQRVAPIAGPTAHYGSNWERPGDEWGTFFRLDESGEWVLQVQRGSDTASLPITVTPA